MKLTLIKPVLLGALAAFALSGCEQLTVESTPSGEVVACDQAFTGWWRVQAESVDGDDDDALHLHVSDDCTRWVTVETDADGQRKQEDLSSQMRFHFRRIGDAGYLAVSDVPNNPDGKREVGEGYALLRYVGASIASTCSRATRAVKRIASPKGWCAARSSRARNARNVRSCVRIYHYPTLSGQCRSARTIEGLATHHSHRTEEARVHRLQRCHAHRFG